MTCRTCGYALYRCFSCHGLVCRCVLIPTRVHYREDGSPYRRGIPIPPRDKMAAQMEAEFGEG